MDSPIHVTKRGELRAVACTLGVRPDWHEPDEQGVDARVFGSHLDNAGFWGANTIPGGGEYWVSIYKDGSAVADVNLADLLSWACEEPEPPKEAYPTRGNIAAAIGMVGLVKTAINRCKDDSAERLLDSLIVTLKMWQRDTPPDADT